VADGRSSPTYNFRWADFELVRFAESPSNEGPRYLPGLGTSQSGWASYKVTSTVPATVSTSCTSPLLCDDGTTQCQVFPRWGRGQRRRPRRERKTSRFHRYNEPGNRDSGKRKRLTLRKVFAGAQTKADPHALDVYKRSRGRKG